MFVRISILGIIPLLVMVPLAEGASLLNTPFVSIHVDGHSAGEEDCALKEIEKTGLADFCPLRWQDNETLAPGDDRFVLATFADEATIIIRPPVGEDKKTLKVNSKKLNVSHPAYTFFNTTWTEANDTRPDVLTEVVSFDSRPKRTREGSPDWGVFVFVHPVASFTGPYAMDYVGFCWDTCFLDYQDYLHQNETTMRPFPNGVVARNAYGHDTDGEIWETMWNTVRIPCQLWNITKPELCETTSSSLRPHHTFAFGAYQNATPTVFVAAQVNQTTVNVYDPPGHWPYTAEAQEPSKANGRLAEISEASSQPPVRPMADDPELPGKRHASMTDPSEATFTLSGSRVAEHKDAALPDSPNFLSVLAVGAMASLAFLLGAWALYHRIQRDRLLEQETRRRVYEIISEEPGIRVGTLTTRLGLNYNTVKSHVRRLEEYGLVKHDGGRQRRYFVSGESNNSAKVLQTLENPTARAIHNMLACNGPLDQPSMGEALGLPPFAVRRAVATLGEAGLVARRRDGRRIVVTLLSENHEEAAP